MTLCIGAIIQGVQVEPFTFRFKVTPTACRDRNQLYVSVKERKYSEQEHQKKIDADTR